MATEDALMAPRSSVMSGRGSVLDFKRSLSIAEPHTRYIVQLDSDLKTNAWIQIIGLPTEAHGYTRGAHRFVPLCKVIIVSFLQLLMSYTTYCFVKNSMVRTMENPLLTAYELYVASNTTIDKGLVNDLCGDWENMETVPGQNGPLASIKMPDGSVYAPHDEFNMFYNMKMPFRDFNYAHLGLDGRSVMDNVLYVIHEGLTINPFGGGAGYSMLFVAMSAIWIFAIFIEYRGISHNFGLAWHFQDDPAAESDWVIDGDKFKLARLPMRGKAVIYGNCFLRALVVSCLVYVGCMLLTYTTGKMDLILNSLALLFVLEIDDLFYLATNAAHHQQFLDDLDPIELELSQGSMAKSWSVISSYIFPTLPIVANVLFAMWLRNNQLRVFKRYFKLTAAMCLFAGPTPGDETGLIAPAAGFCDSLLGATCAPLVTPASTLQKHGVCVLTDQRMATVGSSYFYMDEPTLFAGRQDTSGHKKSWATWGDGLPVMYKKGIWNVGPYQDKMRKNCLQMYQVTGTPEYRILDSNTGEVLPGAPFYCSRDRLWKAVFGKFTEGKAAATDIRRDNLDLVAELEDPEVVAAIDACASSTRLVTPHDDRINAPYPTTAAPTTAAPATPKPKSAKAKKPATSPKAFEEIVTAPAPPPVLVLPPAPPPVAVAPAPVAPAPAHKIATGFLTSDVKPHIAKSTDDDSRLAHADISSSGDVSA